MNEKIQQTYPVFDFWWYACDAIDFGTFLADLLRDFVVVVVNEVVIASVSNKSKLETATFRAKTRQIPPQKISPKTATILTLTATILEIFKYSFYKTM